MTSEMRQLYIQHGKNYINIIKGRCSRDEENLLYNLSCNVPYVQQNNPATNQNQKQPNISIYVHVTPTGLIAPMIYIQPSNFVRQKTVTASFSIAFQNLSVKPEELGLSFLSQSLTFGHDKPRIIFLFCRHHIYAASTSLRCRSPCLHIPYTLDLPAPNDKISGDNSIRPFTRNNPFYIQSLVVLTDILQNYKSTYLAYRFKA